MKECKINLKYSLIMASDPNGVIGKDNDLPWPQGELAGDLKRFRLLTEGKVCLMGRNTYESLPMYPKGLPGRLNIVLTNQDLAAVTSAQNLLRSVQTKLTHLDEDIDLDYLLSDNVVFINDRYHQLYNVLIEHFNFQEPETEIEIMVVGGAKLYDDIFYRRMDLMSLHTGAGYWQNDYEGIKIRNEEAETMYNFVNKGLHKTHLTLTNKLYNGNVKVRLVRDLLTQYVSEQGYWVINDKPDIYHTHVNFEFLYKG